MKFFLDTADIAEIEEAASWGVLAGVTTNPTLYSRVGGKLSGFHDHLKRICEICDGPVSGETVGLKRDEIVREGEELAALAPNIIVKVPVMPEGLAATKTLSDKGIKGCYYGSGNPSEELASLVQLAAAERLRLAEVVTNLTDLDGIPGGLERLRRGAGGRTVAIIDREAAGA